MAMGTSYIQGLVSGLDTGNIIQQLAAIRRKPIERMQNQRGVLESKLALYQSLSASMAALQVSARDLADASTLITRSASVSDATRLAASAQGTAAAGSYEVVVHDLAQVHKIASGAISAASEALGHQGSFLLNGVEITLSADDTLNDLRDAINQSGAGVTATVLQVGKGDVRLMLTANVSGVENQIQLVDTNETGILRQLGFLAPSTSLTHTVADGFQSAAFTNPSISVARETGISTAPAGTIQINGTAVTIDLAADSLEDIAGRISAQVSGVTAEVVTEELDGATVYRLQVIGSEGIPALADDNNVLQSLGVLRADFGDERQAARDARVTIDGIEVARATNSLDDVITGVSMELIKANASETVTITVGLNLDSVVSRVQSFVNSYNRIANMISQAQSFDAEAGTGGLLFGEANILRLEEGLHSAVNSAVTFAGGASRLLSSAGITSNASGGLSLDASKLRSALESDPDVVSKLFGLSTSTSHSAVSVTATSGRTADSGSAGYAVAITQAATRATAASASLASGISLDETLTFDGTRSITLTAGMSLTEASKHLNAWFGTYRLPYEATVDGDRLRITHEAYGSGQTIHIKSSLDRGMGGTDLAGEMAGESATYAGLDVAGTINGEACIGRGQYLRALQGNESTSGMELKITAAAAGDLGTVVVARGAASRLAEYIGMITDATDGMLTRGVEGVEADIAGVDADIEKIEDSIDRYTSTMWEKFIAMESKLSSASILEQYISGQIAALRNAQSRK